jgi:hypothetical protein
MFRCKNKFDDKWLLRSSSRTGKSNLMVGSRIQHFLVIGRRLNQTIPLLGISDLRV